MHSFRILKEMNVKSRSSFQCFLSGPAKHSGRVCIGPPTRNSCNTAELTVVYSVLQVRLGRTFRQFRLFFFHNRITLGDFLIEGLRLLPCASSIEFTFPS